MTTGVTAGSIASASAVGVVPQLDFADTAVVSHAIRFSEGGQNCSRQRALNRCPLIGMSARSLQQAVAGEIAMRGYAWLLLRVMLSQSARAELPAPLIA